MNLNKKFFKKTDWTTTVFLIVGIVIVVNYLSSSLFYRWDITKNKNYSISAVSKGVVGKLDDIVNIKIYFSKELPAQYITLRQEVADILDEYQTYSHGKVQVEYMDPKNDEATAQELYMLGIPEIQFNVVEKDKYQVVKGYLGMLIKHGDKSEPIPVVESTKNLEYQLTVAIKKVIAKESLTLGYLTSNGTIKKDSLKSAYKKLNELYDIQEIDLSKTESIPENIKTMIIAGPTEKFNDKQLKAIDFFVMKGGSLLVMAESVKIEQGLQATTNDTGLEKILDSYGVKINKDLVLDQSSGQAAFSQGFITFMLDYPLWPKISKTGFDQENASVSKLETLVLPWASSLDVDSEKIKDAKISYLAKTSNKSWRQTDSFNLNPQQGFTSKSYASYNVAASISGEFNSAFDKNKTGRSRILVVGDSNFAEEGILQNYPDNIIFFLNIVDSITMDEDLINIRSKGISEAPINELSDKARAAIRYTNVFGMTLIVLTFGLARYYLRKRKKNFGI